MSETQTQIILWSKTDGVCVHRYVEYIDANEYDFLFWAQIQIYEKRWVFDWVHCRFFLSPS